MSKPLDVAARQVFNECCGTGSTFLQTSPSASAGTGDGDVSIEETLLKHLSVMEQHLTKRGDTAPQPLGET